jgi:uncharacterized protein
VKILAFSDLHRSAEKARRIVEKAPEADVVIGAGDIANFGFGLGTMLSTLGAIDLPAVLVCGNHEKPDALRRAAARAWPTAAVLHGDGIEIDGIAFYGLGAAVPPTPFPWGYDVSEEEAERLLAGCPEGAVLVVHAPPQGHLDRAMGRHLGSQAILQAIERAKPRLVVCGHIHQCHGQEARIGPTRVLNAGPHGTLLDV